MSDLPKSDELFSHIDHRPPKGKDWMDIPVDIRQECTATRPTPRAWKP